MRPPRILVLKTGTTFSSTRRRFGDFDRWFLDALRGTEALFEVRDLAWGATPRPQGHDGVIVTGSPAAVYEGPPFLPALLEWLRHEAARPSIPVLCVCFGAQALAAALGGRVGRCPAGWEIGTVRIRLTGEGRQDPLLAGEDGELRLQATHQDWVESLPSATTVLARNAAAPYQAFRTGDRLWGVQFHPEASPAILEDLIRQRRTSLGGDGSVEALLRHLRPTPAGGRLLRRFVGLAAGRIPSAEGARPGAAAACRGVAGRASGGGPRSGLQRPPRAPVTTSSAPLRIA